VIFMQPFLQIITTTENAEEADKIAQHLITEKLAACVQILGPIKSIYRWKGKIEQSGEWICFIKTKEELFAPVEKAIKSLHSYETPEIIAVPISLGSADYLNWLKNEVA